MGYHASNHTQTELAIAAVLVAPWERFSEVGIYFPAYLYKKCSFFVPYFIPQFQGQADEEYMKSLCYRFTNGVAESEELPPAEGMLPSYFEYTSTS